VADREPQEGKPRSGVRTAVARVLTGVPNTRLLALSIGNEPETLPVMNAPAVKEATFTRKFVMRN